MQDVVFKNTILYCQPVHSPIMRIGLNQFWGFAILFLTENLAVLDRLVWMFIIWVYKWYWCPIHSEQ